MGQLHLILGPMFSGKTTELLGKLALLADIGQRCLFVNHSYDTRGEVVSSHRTNYCLPSNVTIIKTSSLDVDVESFDVIGIDEGQFFSDIAKVVQWVDKGKIVYISSLDGDYQRRPFDKVLALITEADSVTKKLAYCRSCLNKGVTNQAPFTKRVVDNCDRVLVGGSEFYQPTCRQCM